MPVGPGSRLDAYELIRPLGAGGMGVVWLATDTTLGRKVALKLLPAELTRDPARVSRFEQEARAASALNHPNVCTILALGETGDIQHYIAMEYVEGETLRKRLSTTRMTVRDALEVAVQIASALTAAHAAGIVHRDIKPENVVVRRDGLVKVLDFGLAKLLAPLGSSDVASAETAFATDIGAVVGTVAYMSPEEARGDAVDGRTDIWSLGVTFYEMIAGRSPFRAPTGAETVAAILDREPLPLTRVVPGAYRELQRIVSKALRKDRAQRYQTIRDLQLDLEALRAELASPSDPAPQAPASASGSIRHRAPRGRAALYALAAVLGVGGTLAALWSRQGRPEPSSAGMAGGTVQRHLSRLTFGDGLQTGITFAPDGRFIAYASDRAGNFDIWVQPVAQGEPVQVTNSTAQETQPDWSPDGSQIAYRSEVDGGGIHIVPALGGPERRLVAGGFRPRFAPDGKTVLYLSSLEHETTNVTRPDVHVISAAGGAPRRLFEHFWHEVESFHGIAWHPDARRVSFIGSYRGRLGFFTVPLASGRPVASVIPAGVALGLAPDPHDQHTSASGVWLRDFRWSPSGRHLLFSGSSNGLQNLWRVGVDPDTLEWRSPPERLTSGLGADSGPAVSPDGRRAAFTIRSERTRVWVTPFDETRGRTNGGGEPQSPGDFALANFDLSRDGRKLAYVGVLTGDGRTQVWEVMLETGERKLRLSDRMARSFLRYSSSADALACIVDGKPDTVRVLPADAIEERIVSHGEFMFPFDWEPDGTAIIGSAAEREAGPWYVVSWPLAGAPHAERRVQVRLRDASVSLWGARYSPDGKWLVFNAHGAAGNSVVGVASSSGPANRPWRRLTDGREWADKPRWSPDGSSIYYISSATRGVFNLHRLRFDRQSGRTVGPPIQITHFDSPARTISGDLGSSEVGIARGRIALTIVEVTGSIWMLDNVDK